MYLFPNQKREVCLKRAMNLDIACRVGRKLQKNGANTIPLFDVSLRLRLFGIFE